MKKQVLRSAHMQKLDKLLRIKKSNNINGMKKMCDQIEVFVRNFKAWNIDIVTKGAIISTIFKRKATLENQSNFIWKLSKRYLATG